jgi:hypothetical protein
MNQTQIVCKYQKSIDDSIDLELDLSIVPNVGDVHLYWNGEEYEHLQVVKRQIVKATSTITYLIIQFEKR